MEWRKRRDEHGEAGEPAADPIASALEHLHRGTSLEEQGDLAGAEAAYRKADALGSGEGASNLGVLLFERGAVEEAEEVLRRSDERGHPMGTFRLGFLLDSAGDAEGAEQAYRRAVERGSFLAAGNLAYLLRQRGDIEAAIPFYQYALHAPDADLARRARNALVNLGALPKPRPVPPPGFDPEHSVLDSILWIGGDPADDRVRRAREFVFRFQIGKVTAEKALDQARMWQAFEEENKAEALLRRGAELGGAEAAFALAVLLADRGETAAARDHFAEAAARGDATLAAEARNRLHSLP
ncbi:tetratricopeptide repeat protein [Actinoallomurus iriomotensis]|uniref:Tetratricopeptide repeat protein n=1 Tax=Actinoallomurus iriomotensis TaxID=478107 RepID=A0A9W6S1Y9_9ACTN|nr:tetratricopeptide repeat protein [Actinoallomurus iriomotensis]GLY85939.1 hypothetical protein Airi02_038680 [Actinoallomurus iriomotensis]